MIKALTSVSERVAKKELLRIFPKKNVALRSETDKFISFEGNDSFENKKNIVKLNKEQFLKIKGQNVKIMIERDVPVKKEFAASNTVRKVTVMVVRAGVDYDAMKSVQDKRKSGELPAENAGLPWGEWETFPHIIKHKDKLYYRFSKGSNAPIPSVVWELNGKIVEKEALAPMLYAKDLQPREDFDCFTVAEENLTLI